MKMSVAGAIIIEGNPMLAHPTLEQLSTMGLHGMAKAFADLAQNADSDSLTHGEWLALLLERETTHRHDRRLAARLRYARLRHHAAPEDIDWKAARGLDRALFTTLLKADWIDAADAAILTGPTGVGKSWLACALGLQACRNNRSVLYVRAGKLFADLALAHADGRYPRLMRALCGVKLLIVDDWGMAPLEDGPRRDLMEILEERYGRGALIVTSQLPVDRWHDIIGDPTYADAMLDRIVHNAHRVALTGDSLRRLKKPYAIPAASGA
jgi:DNA replication protein DnaC